VSELGGGGKGHICKGICPDEEEVKEGQLRNSLKGSGCCEEKKGEGNELLSQG